jgi:hypothetical protein
MQNFLDAAADVLADYREGQAVLVLVLAFVFVAIEGVLGEPVDIVQIVVRLTHFLRELFCLLYEVLYREEGVLALPLLLYHLSLLSRLDFCFDRAKPWLLGRRLACALAAGGWHPEGLGEFGEIFGDLGFGVMRLVLGLHSI